MKLKILSLLAITTIAISTQAETIPVPSGLTEFEQKVWLEAFDASLYLVRTGGSPNINIINNTNRWFNDIRSSLPATK